MADGSSSIPVTRIEGHAKITHPPRRRRQRVATPSSTWSSSAASRSSARAGRSARCPASPRASAASARSATCWPRPRRATPSWPCNIPPAADKLRRLMNLGQIVQTHALSFFHLSAPDFLLGWDTPPAKRNVFGLIAANPELARAGIRLRQFGQEIIEVLGGQKIHPAWAVPGGVRSPLTEEGRDQHPRLAARSLRHHARWRFDLFKKTARRPTRRRSRSSATSPRSSWAWWSRTAPGNITAASCASSTAAAASSPTSSIRTKYHEYIGEAVQSSILPQVALLQAPGLPGRHVSRRAAGPAERLPSRWARPWPTPN